MLFRSRSHRAFVSASVCLLFWITLSHLMTQTRWPASETRICRSLAAPRCLIGVICGCWFWCAGCLLCFGELMHPIPRIRPRLISGHWFRLCGHICFASFQIVFLVFTGHRVRMCSIESTSRHVVQYFLCPKPGMCPHIGPTMCV